MVLDRIYRAMPYVLFAALVGSIVAGMLLPVYTDEVAWRFSMRAALDGVDKLYSDTCGPNTLATPPFFMMPARYFSAWVNMALPSPFYVRLEGVLCGLTASGMLWTLTQKIAPAGATRNAVRMLVFALLCFGMMPLLLVWSRPEQPLLLALLSALLVALPGWQETAPPPARTVWRRAALITVAAVLALSWHMKGVVLLPAFAFCLFTCARGHDTVRLRIAASALLIVLALVAARYWVLRVSCPNDPVIAAVYGRTSVLAMLSNGQHPVDVLGALLFSAHPDHYFFKAAPQDLAMSAWVVKHALVPGTQGLWNLSALAFWWFGYVVGGISLVRALYLCVKERRFDPAPMLALLLAGLVAVWSATLLIKNIYDAALILPVMTIAIALSIASARLPEAVLRPLAILLVAHGVAALYALALMWQIYLPSLNDAASRTGYLERQPFSQSVYGYADLRPRIEQAAAQCGIGKHGRRDRGLLIDDVTYFAFMGSYLPQHAIGVLGEFHGNIDDPLAYLRSKQSDGVIAACRVLPPAMRAKARQSGEFCCIDLSQR